MPSPIVRFFNEVRAEKAEVAEAALLRPALSEMGFAELAVSGAHAEKLASLPPIHKDPFDRMLVAQSLAEPLVLLTNDGTLAAYGELVKVVS